MEKLNYEKPEIEVIEFEDDVITTSGGNGTNVTQG